MSDKEMPRGEKRPLSSESSDDSDDGLGISAAEALRRRLTVTSPRVMNIKARYPCPVCDKLFITEKAVNSCYQQHRYSQAVCSQREAEEREAEESKMAASTGRRALHYVLKIGNRKEAIGFLKDTLGMQVLRHEEFEKGCEATCNGPYDGKWSKTMVGYGPEDNNFVLELTYNYGISEYRHGNDFVAIEVLKKDLSACADLGTRIAGKKDGYCIKNNGYNFHIYEDESGDKISRVRLSSSNMSRTLQFYEKILEMKNLDKDLVYSKDDCKMTFSSLGEGIDLDRGKAFGRTAFACPTDQLKKIEAQALESAYGESVQTPYVTLPTPGKADVHVVILADPDGHEICFVGDEGFRELSKVDPEADKLLMEAIQADKSDEWFAKKGQGKEKQLD